MSKEKPKKSRSSEKSTASAKLCDKTLVPTKHSDGRIVREGKNENDKRVLKELLAQVVTTEASETCGHRKGAYILELTMPTDKKCNECWKVTLTETTAQVPTESTTASTGVTYSKNTTQIIPAPTGTGEKTCWRAAFLSEDTVPQTAVTSTPTASMKDKENAVSKPPHPTPVKATDPASSPSSSTAHQHDPVLCQLAAMQYTLQHLLDDTKTRCVPICIRTDYSGMLNPARFSTDLVYRMEFDRLYNLIRKFPCGVHYLHEKLADATSETSAESTMSVRSECDDSQKTAQSIYKPATPDCSPVLTQNKESPVPSEKGAKEDPPIPKPFDSATSRMKNQEKSPASKKSTKEVSKPVTPGPSPMKDKQIPASKKSVKEAPPTSKPVVSATSPVTDQQKSPASKKNVKETPPAPKCVTPVRSPVNSSRSLSVSEKSARADSPKTASQGKADAQLPAPKEAVARVRTEKTNLANPHVAPDGLLKGFLKKMATLPATTPVKFAAGVYEESSTRDPQPLKKSRRKKHGASRRSSHGKRKRRTSPHALMKMMRRYRNTSDSKKHVEITPSPFKSSLSSKKSNRASTDSKKSGKEAQSISTPFPSPVKKKQSPAAGKSADVVSKYSEPSMNSPASNEAVVDPSCDAPKNIEDVLMNELVKQLAAANTSGASVSDPEAWTVSLSEVDDAKKKKAEECWKVALTKTTMPVATLKMHTDSWTVTYSETTKKIILTPVADNINCKNKCWRAQQTTVSPAMPPDVSPAKTTVSPAPPTTVTPAHDPAKSPTVSPAKNTVSPAPPTTVTPAHDPAVSPTVSPAKNTVSPAPPTTVTPAHDPAKSPTVSPAKNTVSPAPPTTVTPAHDPAKSPTVSPAKNTVSPAPPTTVTPVHDLALCQLTALQYTLRHLLADPKTRNVPIFILADYSRVFNIKRYEADRIFRREYDRIRCLIHQFPRGVHYHHQEVELRTAKGSVDSPKKRNNKRAEREKSVDSTPAASKPDSPVMKNKESPASKKSVKETSKPATPGPSTMTNPASKKSVKEVPKPATPVPSPMKNNQSPVSKKSVKEAPSTPDPSPMKYKQTPTSKESTKEAPPSLKPAPPLPSPVKNQPTPASKKSVKEAPNYGTSVPPLMKNHQNRQTPASKKSAKEKAPPVKPAIKSATPVPSPMRNHQNTQNSLPSERSAKTAQSYSKSVTSGPSQMKNHPKKPTPKEDVKAAPSTSKSVTPVKSEAKPSSLKFSNPCVLL